MKNRILSTALVVSLLTYSPSIFAETIDQPIISNFKVSVGVNNSRVIEWSGTTGIQTIEVKKGDVTVYKKDSRFTTVTLSKLEPGNYDVYVAGVKIGSFTEEEKSVPISISDFKTVDGPSGSKVISWKGTTGSVTVEIKLGNQVVHKGNTIFSNYTVPKQPSGTYDIYIAGVEVGKLTFDNSSTGSSTEKAQDVIITKKNKDSVRITWRGTKDDVTIEVREMDGKVVSSKETAGNEITIRNLDDDIEYRVYINGASVGTFIIDSLSDNPYEPTLTKIGTTGIKVTWKNTSGFVDVELKLNNKVIDADYTDRRTTVFNNLEKDKEYKIVIDGDHVVTFDLRNIDEANKNKDVKSIRIKTDEDDGTVKISWKGTQGIQTVDLKSGSSTISSKRTDVQEVTFYRVPVNKEYRIFIGGKYVESFTFGDVEDTFENIVIKSGVTPTISWSGSTKNVKVELKKNGQVFFSKVVNNSNVTISGINTGSYDIYLNGLDTKKTITISRSPSSSTITRGNFSDVPSHHWASSAIYKLALKGVVNGFSDGTFKPSDNVTREQFITMLMQSKQMSSTGNYSPFGDVSAQRWSAPYIIAAIEAGVIIPNEYGAFFNPEKPISREEMAILLARAEGLSPGSNSLPFLDAAFISNKPLVQSAVQAGLLKGFPDQTFRPKSYLNRAEAAEVISKIID